MKTISKSEINDKYLLVLVENEEGFMAVDKVAIDNSEAIISKMETMVDNSNRHFWDVYTVFSNYIKIRTSFSLCFPYEYNSSFVDSIHCPKKISYQSIKETEEQYIYSIIPRFYSKARSEKEWMNFIKEKISVLEKPHKRKFVDYAIRYIKCMHLQNAIDKAKSNPKIVMYSSDSIGWTTFDYTINDDIQVQVRTNFVYGSAAYFYLAIKYRDIVLIPYSDLVHYYYAEMKDFISYTRSYVCRRDSWYFALTYVAEFANQVKQSPKEFVHKYIISEITEMMKGLESILHHPEEILNGIKDSKIDYISLRVIRPFDTIDFELFEVLPVESMSVFKAEKITSALLFIETLRKLTDFCSELDNVINRIQDMNISIYPEVIAVIESVKKDLVPLEKEQEKNLKQLDFIENVINGHMKRIEQIVEHRKKWAKKYNKSFDKVDIEEDYEKKHPNYIKALKEKEIFLEKTSKTRQTIIKRKSLLNRMIRCENRLIKMDKGLMKQPNE